MSVVRSFHVGDGDMFYINHDSANVTVIDCCYTEERNRDAHFKEIKGLYNRPNCMTRFISTHPDKDHILGLKEFDKAVGIWNFYVVDNKAVKPDPTDDFEYYCTLRDGDKAYYIKKGCHRKWMNESDGERVSAGIECIWPDEHNEDFQTALNQAHDGTKYNNICPIITYSEGCGSFMWMGDLEKDFVEKIKDEVEWPEVDVLFAPHHGRDSGKASEEVLEKINPQLIVIGEAASKYLNYYQGWNTITQNRAKDITFVCEDGEIHTYSSNKDYEPEIDDLKNKRKSNNPRYGYYLGSLEAR